VHYLTYNWGENEQNVQMRSV
jgi:hypothetical protein